MPYRVSGNWAEVCFSIGIFILVQIFQRFRLGWPEMQKRWKESIGIGVLSVAIGWVGLFCYSLILEMRDIRMLADRIQIPKILAPQLPHSWDQKSVPVRKSTGPNFKGTIEALFFLAQTPKNEGCIGTVAVISANIRNEGTPSIADIGPIFAVLPSGKRIELIRMMSPPEGIAVMGGGVNAYFPAKDFLPNKAFGQSIPQNGAIWGWTWGCAADTSLGEINNLASRIILPFSDVKGRQYEAKANLSDKQIKVIMP